MTTYTKADLAAKVLRQPGLYGPDETISSADQEDAENVAEALVDTLASMNIFIPNGSVAVVPSAWYIPLAQFIALYLLQAFGGPAPTNDQIQGAVMPLRVMSATKATGAVLEGEYM